MTDYNEEDCYAFYTTDCPCTSCQEGGRHQAERDYKKQYEDEEESE